MLLFRVTIGLIVYDVTCGKSYLDPFTYTDNEHLSYSK